jgi:hypothetical protein
MIIVIRPASARGAYASSRTWGGMRWTWLCRATSGMNADDEIVWSWRPWAGAKSAGDEPAGDGDYEVTDTGESTKISVNTVAQGRPECFGGPVVTNSCAFFAAHEAAGAASARSSLRPLLFRGRCLTKLGRNPPRERRPTPRSGNPDAQTSLAGSAWPSLPHPHRHLGQKPPRKSP